LPERLFEIALVLLGVLSATETQYFIKVWGDVTALQFSTTPFMVMIFVWLVKELFKHWISIENWLLLSEFGWELWSITLSYYILFLRLFQIPQYPYIALISSTLLGLVWFGLVIVAHYLEYRTMVEYYRPRWLLKRTIVYLIGGVIMALVFVPT
jgi:hypothetical protein